MTAHATSTGLRHAIGAVIGLVGTVVAFLLLGDALNGSEPVGVARPPAATALTALQMLAGGTVLGGVLLAGRHLSPWAPLTSGLLWGLGALASLADPQGVAALLPPAAVTLSEHQLGLGLTALMILGAVALQPGRAGNPAPEPHDRERTDPRIAPVPTRTVTRTGPRRANGPGPRHRAAPGGAPPVPLPRGRAQAGRRRAY